MPDNNLTKVIGNEILNVLNDLGSNQAQAQVKIQDFLNAIRPDMDAAIKANDSMSMNLLRDRVSIAAARINIDLYAAEQQKITAAVITTLRVLIAVGLAAA